MYSIPVIIKLALFILVALGCLWVFAHLGGLKLADGAQGYVVIYKAPQLNVVTAQGIAPDTGDSLAAHNAYLDEHVRAVLEIRETDGFRDIVIIHWVSLVIAVLCALGFIGTLRSRRKKYKRYFKSQRLYEMKLKL